MYHMSHVITHMSCVICCHISHVMCHISHITCHLFLYFFFYKVVNLVGGGFIINGATAFTFKEVHRPESYMQDAGESAKVIKD